MARSAGFEPATSRIEVSWPIQLAYERVSQIVAGLTMTVARPHTASVNPCGLVSHCITRDGGMRKVQFGISY
jgi:hypothetical protein